MTTATSERRDTSSIVICKSPGIRFLEPGMRRYPVSIGARREVYEAIEAASMFAAREMAELINSNGGTGKYNLMIDLGEETCLLEPKTIALGMKMLEMEGSIPGGDFSASICCRPKGDYLSMVYRTRT
jgi:hypothetical protein